ncbi:MAG: hypothetical protein GQ558_06440 [Thermoplasmata archaeon]|nr:hypothetical protein [Thermoplasmata archaeon]
MLLIVSIIMAGLALTIHLADLDVDTRVGIVDFKLDTDWKAGSVTYTGSASEFGVEVEDTQVLLEGTGNFQEAVGFLKGTAKRVTNSITPYTTDFLGTKATLTVTTETETIPWWVVGVSTPCLVEVELIESMNVSSLTVDRVYLEFRRVVDGETLKKEVWSKNVDDAFVEVGDKRTYKADLTVGEDWGEFQIFGMVDVTMVDADGVTSTKVYRSYSTEPKAITIWTIPTEDGVRIALLIAAMPVYVLGMIFAIGGAIAIVLNKKGRLVLPIAAATLLLLGALFFMLGVGQLADLVGYPDDLSFAAGFFIMLLGFVPAVIVGVMVAYEKNRYEKDEEDISDPIEVVSSAENTITDENTIKEEDGS